MASKGGVPWHANKRNTAIFLTFSLLYLIDAIAQRRSCTAADWMIVVSPPLFSPWFLVIYYHSFSGCRNRLRYQRDLLLFRVQAARKFTSGHGALVQNHWTATGEGGDGIKGKCFV